MNSLKVREFRQSIIDFSNKSDLPAEVKRMVFAEILQQAEMKAVEEIKQEILKRDAAEGGDEINE